MLAFSTLNEKSLPLLMFMFIIPLSIPEFEILPMRLLSSINDEIFLSMFILTHFILTIFKN